MRRLTVSSRGRSAGSFSALVFPQRPFHVTLRKRCSDLPRLTCLPPASTDFRNKHGYAFDPGHGYGLEELLTVAAPEEPPDYAPYWQARYGRVRGQAAKSQLRETGIVRAGWRVLDWQYQSTDDITIRGWALLPAQGEVCRALVVGHGYGGRDQPEFDLPVEQTALFFPCARGLGRSRLASIPSDADRHVLHGIESRERYILGGCVEDLWLAVTAVLEHQPGLAGHLGYMGISFGGGVGVMAAAWDERLQRVHVNVPSFGHQPLRMKLETVGSAASLQAHLRQHPEAMEVLRYFDAAQAARYLHRPTHCACALFDPSVAPAGQFAISNALPGPQQLFVLSAGHHDYPAAAAELAALRQEIYIFFRDL